MVRSEEGDPQGTPACRDSEPPNEEWRCPTQHIPSLAALTTILKLLDEFLDLAGPLRPPRYEADGHRRGDLPEYRQAALSQYESRFLRTFGELDLGLSQIMWFSLHRPDEGYICLRANRWDADVPEGLDGVRGVVDELIVVWEVAYTKTTDHPKLHWNAIRLGFSKSLTLSTPQLDDLHFSRASISRGLNKYLEQEVENPGTGGIEQASQAISTKQVGNETAADPPSHSVDYRALASSLRERGWLQTARLVEFMEDRPSASYSEIAEAIHGDAEATDGAIRKMLSDARSRLRELESPLTFYGRSSQVFKTTHPE